MNNNAPLFTGSSRRRPVINLGRTSSGADTSSPNDVLQRARLERQNRERQREMEKAANTVQSFYKARKVSFSIRSRYRTKFYDSLPITESNFVSISRLAVFLLVSDPFVYRHTVTSPECNDILVEWARALAINGCFFTSSSIWPKLSSSHTQSSPDELPSSIVLIRQLSTLLLSRIAFYPKSQHTPLFLQLLKQLLDVQKYESSEINPEVCKNITLYHLHHDFYQHLSQFIGSFDAPGKLLISASGLIVSPLRTFPKSVSSQVDESNRNLVLDSLAKQILTLPTLFKYLPEKVTTNLHQQIPVLDDLPVRLNSTSDSISSWSPLQKLVLVYHLILIAKSSLSNFSSSQSFNSYLNIAKLCFSSIPRDVLLLTSPDSIFDDDNEDDSHMELDSGTDSDTAMDLDSDKKAKRQKRSPRLVYKRELELLNSISSQVSTGFILGLRDLSTRYSATSRPYFVSFMICLFQAFPSSKDDVVSSLVYDRGSAAPGGLLREMWRGWLRSSALTKRIAGGREGSDKVISTLTDETYSEDWCFLVLLCELYSRTLLTLGDDEFHTAGSRNPLTIDEVISFSGVLRNAAFALYWHEGKFTNSPDKVSVGGTMMDVLSLRSLLTGLLSQIHARDSRQPFTPEGHWIMTSQFDLGSFLNTVIYEDMQNPDNEIYIPTHRQRMLLNRYAKKSITNPRLGVLNNIPFVIPFESRVKVFSQFVANDTPPRSIYNYDRRPIKIRRNHVAQDAFSQMAGLGKEIKNRLGITFVDEHGIQESGIDGGGLFKELMTRLVKEVFNTDYGLWVANRKQELYPSPTTYSKEEDLLKWYKFLGQLVGKALYSGILINVPFAGFFIAKWLEKRTYLDNLKSLDPDLYSGLLKLKNYTGDVENDMALNFAIDIEEFGESKTIDLKPNGRNIPVTNANRIEYITLVSHFKLNIQIREQSEAFVTGLYEVIDPRWIRMFNEMEISKLVGGVDEPIDIDDLKVHTVYGGFNESDEIVRNFWHVVREFDEEQKKKLISYVTSCPRPPLLGFSELQPKFGIRDGGSDINHLPTASTCVNLLKLPRYTTRQMLREKLLYAITSEAGFDLS